MLAVAVIAFAAPGAVSAEQAEGFARNIWSAASFLDQSSRLALTRSRNRRLREFARAEAVEQTTAANTMAAWMDSTSAARGSAARPQKPASAGNIASIPFHAAANVTADLADAIDGVQTGRSVAVDAEPERPSAPSRAITVPSFGMDLDRLGALSGRPFDDLFRTSQANALLQLSTLYASYIQSGGDPGLRALAVRELPKVNGRLASIRSLR